MDKMKKAAVDWYVNFAQMNLGKLGPGDRAKLEVEASEYLLPDTDEGQIAKMKKLFTYRVGYTTADGVRASGDQYPWIEILPSRHTDEFWSTLVNCQQTVIGCLKNMMKKRGAVSALPAHFFFVAKEEFQIKILPVTKNHDEYVLIRLARALEGLPVGSLQTCQSCNRIFFNPSRRIMKYCSHKCLWRFNAQRKREADREGYNERQREIMKRKYERDAKKKIAPNVKIARRKTKDTTVDK